MIISVQQMQVCIGTHAIKKKLTKAFTISYTEEEKIHHVFSQFRFKGMFVLLSEGGWVKIYQHQEFFCKPPSSFEHRRQKIKMHFTKMHKNCGILKI